MGCIGVFCILGDRRRNGMFRLRSGVVKSRYDSAILWHRVADLALLNEDMKRILTSYPIELWLVVLTDNAVYH